MERRAFIRKTATAAAGAFMVPTIVPSFVFGKNAPSNKINVGQIGRGRYGGVDMINVMGFFDKTRVIAAADVDRRRLEHAGEQISTFYKEKTGRSDYVDVKLYDDYKELIANKEIDAVIISTPDHWHAQPAIEAALARKDIYIQKPLSLTVEEGRQVSDIVQRQGVVLQVGTQQRSMEQFRVAAELVRNGRIGKLHTVKVGLPVDPSGPVVEEMPVPGHLNYDMWLGSTPYVPYHEMRVHPEEGYGRPGWLRIRSYSPGMISGWGSHHFDSAAWGMNTEFTGPKTIEAIAEFPHEGVWDVHGAYLVKAEYDDGLTLYSSGAYPNGIRYEGSEGWIFVSRGDYQATDTDPDTGPGSDAPLQASDPAILRSVTQPNELHLERSGNHYLNWLEAVEQRKQPIVPAEIGHRTNTIALISEVAMNVPGKLEWNPRAERFVNNDLANTMLGRPQRYPYGTKYIQY